MTGQDNIQDILQSVKIPCQPPNKSQWKKLEIAIKFINARETLEKRGKRMESMMKTKIWILLFPLFSKASLSKKSAEQKRYTLKYFVALMSALSFGKWTRTPLSTLCRKASLKIEPKSLNICGEKKEESYEGKSRDKVEKKSSRWDKVSESLHSIA